MVGALRVERPLRGPLGVVKTVCGVHGAMMAWVASRLSKVLPSEHRDVCQAR